jgi:hypothetical protein
VERTGEVPGGRDRAWVKRYRALRGIPKRPRLVRKVLVDA